MDILVSLAVLAGSIWLIRRMIRARRGKKMSDGENVAGGCAIGCLGLIGFFGALFFVGLTWNLIEHGTTRGDSGVSQEEANRTMQSAVSSCSGSLGHISHSQDYSRVTTNSVEAAQCVGDRLSVDLSDMYDDVASGSSGSTRGGGYSVSWSGSEDDFQATFVD